MQDTHIDLLRHADHAHLPRFVHWASKQTSELGVGLPNGFLTEIMRLRLERCREEKPNLIFIRRAVAHAGEVLVSLFCPSTHTLHDLGNHPYTSRAGTGGSGGGYGAYCARKKIREFQLVGAPTGLGTVTKKIPVIPLELFGVMVVQFAVARFVQY